ncbi:tetratricopeptide repeat protein [Fidelibacter multiformis]|uniref:tetratricopeptide repeat protein n=1 Tax=Fidelibacter multiformis TaxID=3377529 RepID=UPI0037DD96EE
MKRLYIIVLLIACGTALYGNMSTQEADALFKRARSAESAGDLTKAQALYDSLYTVYPRNPRYLSYYKSVLIRTGNLEKAAEVTETLYRMNPGNINYLAEWGVLLMANHRQEEAFRLWDPYLRPRGRQSRLPRLAMMYLTAYNNGSGLPEMIAFFREKTDEALLQSQTYFSDLINRQMWQPALEEFLLHRELSPSTLPLLIRELKSLAAEAPLYGMVMDTLQNLAQSVDDYRLIADLATASERYDAAVRIFLDHISLFKTDELLQAARHLFNVSQHQLSLTLLRNLEHTINDDLQRENLIFLKALNYDALSDKPAQFGPEIIPPYHSVFLALPVRPSYTIHKAYIDSAYGLYENLSDAQNPEIRYESRLRLAHIHFFITGDLDKAADLLEEIPASLPVRIRNRMITEYITCKILQKDEESARRKIWEAPASYRLDATEEDRFRLNLLFVDLAFNRPDSLEKHVNEALALISSRDEYSNDILALASYLQIGAEEPGMIELESHIRKREWIQAMEKARELMGQTSPVRNLAALRLEQILFQTGRMDELTHFWESNGVILKKDPVMGDYFTLRQAAYFNFTENQNLEKKLLLEFLSNWPESPYTKSIRSYLRP